MWVAADSRHSPWQRPDRATLRRSRRVEEFNKVEGGGLGVAIAEGIQLALAHGLQLLHLGYSWHTFPHTLAGREQGVPGGVNDASFGDVLLLSLSEARVRVSCCLQLSLDAHTHEEN